MEEKFKKEMADLETRRGGPGGETEREEPDMQKQLSQELKVMDQNENEYETIMPKIDQGVN